LVVVAAGNTDSTPKGPTIEVFFNFGGGCYQKYRQHPQGPAIDVFFDFGDGCCREYWQHSLGGSPSTFS
jgi:hypothetical protein